MADNAAPTQTPWLDWFRTRDYTDRNSDIFDVACRLEALCHQQHTALLALGMDYAPMVYEALTAYAALKKSSESQRTL